MALIFDDDEFPVDYDYEDYDDDFTEDPFDTAMENCGIVSFETGECLAAGSEDCDFECPIRRMVERGDFDEPDDETDNGHESDNSR